MTLVEYQDAYRIELLYNVVKSISQNLGYPLLSSSTGLDEDCQVYKLLPKVSRIEIMSCEISRLCEIEFLDAINKEKQSISKIKNKTGNLSGTGSDLGRYDIEPDMLINTRFDWLYTKLSKIKPDLEQNLIIEIIAGLNEQWQEMI